MTATDEIGTFPGNLEPTAPDAFTHHIDFGWVESTFQGYLDGISLDSIQEGDEEIIGERFMPTAENLVRHLAMLRFYADNMEDVVETAVYRADNDWVLVEDIYDNTRLSSDRVDAKDIHGYLSQVFADDRMRSEGFIRDSFNTMPEGPMRDAAFEAAWAFKIDLIIHSDGQIDIVPLDRDGVDVGFDQSEADRFTQAYLSDSGQPGHYIQEHMTRVLQRHEVNHHLIAE